MSQSLIEELFEKSFINLVDVPGLLFVESETQGQCPKENFNGNKRSWINQSSRYAL